MGEALAKHVLSRETGLNPSRIGILRDEYGKPYLPGHAVHFNLSHSGGLVLLAVSELGEIGCDVEDATRTVRNPEAVRRKIAQPGEEEVPLFELWVKKEAVYKAGGPGRVYYPAMPEGYIAAVCCRADEEAAEAEEVFLNAA